MKLSDYVAEFLARVGVQTVFGVTGGAVVHLFDSASNKGLKTVFTHHEQAAAFAAQAYARIQGLGAGFFTTGPGGTNAITGISAAWLDSIPVIYIGGQVRSSQIKSKEIRQQGAQELDIISIVSSIVKYATTLKDALQIRYELEKCLYFATSGRPGPVYLEIPLDFQWAQIDESSLPSFQPDQKLSSFAGEQANSLLQGLAKAQRPLLLLGHGIRLGKAEKELEQFLNQTQIPYITTWNAIDLVNGHDPLNLGRAGMFGGRVANIAVQMCDFLCCVGSHLPMPVTTSNFSQFAKRAEIGVVNIDPAELKNQRVPVKYPVQEEVREFLKKAIRFFNQKEISIDPWKTKCAELNSELQESVPIEESRIDAYLALQVINEHFGPQDMIVVDGGGTIVQIAFQILKIKKGQRLLIDAGLCSMGSGLPQSVGVAFARKSGHVICLCGDGSFQFNVHEMQTIYHHQLPVKIFIFNNNGYLSIRHTQEEFLEQRFIGSNGPGGVSVPDIQAIAAAYKIPSHRVSSSNQLKSTLPDVFACDGPVLCEILLPSDQDIRPKIGFEEIERGKFTPRPMEDMHPYLPRSKLAEIFDGLDPVSMKRG